MTFPMTTQYIVGEFSALLGDLLPVPDDLLCGALRDLQHEVEASPVSRLMCWRDEQSASPMWGSLTVPVSASAS